MSNLLLCDWMRSCKVLALEDTLLLVLCNFGLISGATGVGSLSLTSRADLLWDSIVKRKGGDKVFSHSIMFLLLLTATTVARLTKQNA